ncbi:hypothetical protein TanjilG_24323 [Lupinus angustifolius]|uniref:SAC domain-containing protein n=1 Tax=Lupinus angustifolius TaxID=3871 RepID=A0A1J7I088_LUPAN|nr:hypothetical protein TanjilG_24323 [Lupinus angustifolius]
MNIEPSSGSPERFNLYDELQLLEFQDKFVIKSHQSPNHGFSIDRRDGNINLLYGDTNLESPSNTSTIYGVVGTIRLVVGTYAIVITSRKEVGSFLGFPVYHLMSMRVLACNEALRFATGQEKKDEAYFMTLLKAVESMPGLYYSYETDITLNLQRRSKLVEGWMSKPIWKQADPRFVWNRHLLEELIECRVEGKRNTFYSNINFTEMYTAPRYVTMMLTNNNIIMNLEWLVIIRQHGDIGTRMWRRGANLDGDTANFIETEQLFENEDFSSSFLLVRGSIPILWEQIVDLSYKPHLRPNIVVRHFNDLNQRYGGIIAVDLTDKHGEEGQLSAAYAAEMQNQQNVRYVPFDFHCHCGSSNFDNLKILYDEISEDFEKQRYFLIDSKGNELEEQKGVVRHNCIDSLDRTNVTQCYLAEKSLNLQLQRIGVLTLSEGISMFDEEYGKFRTLWAEQGDEISLEYAGTYALKGDLVRYGKQTIFGMIKDGMSSISRYYLNNFHDGDALDLISGHYTVSRNSDSPLLQNSLEPFPKTVSTQIFPVASALIIGGLTATSFTLQQGGRNEHRYVSSVLFAGITAGVVAIVKSNGRHLCSRPRLCGLL